MNFSLYTDYPLWFILFCFLAGAAYAFILYRNEKRFDETKPWVRISLPILRFLVVTLLAFFLLSPLLRNISTTIEKPILIFAQDNSESVVFGKDSSYYKNEYRKSVSDFILKLSDKYDTNNYSFGDVVHGGLGFEFKDKQTDISSLFDELETRFSNRNVGAVVIASDGLYNKGQNPVYASLKDKFPVYTIALGDTTIRKDLVLAKVLHNRLAYLGNKFPIEIQITAKELSGKTSTCTVSKVGEVLFTQQISITNNKFNLSIPVLLDAKAIGLQRYSIRLSSVEGEITIANNARDIFVDVLDGRQKILILADAPHPDVSAIKTSLELKEGYEVQSSLAADFNKPVAGYDLIILHQLPSAKNNIDNILAQIDKENIPVLFVLGSQTLVGAFNKAQPDLQLPAASGKLNDVAPVLAKDFSLFTTSNELRSYASRFSPLQSPFGNYKGSALKSVLFYQQIGLVESDIPLLFFSQEAVQKRGYLCGEGIWRWRLQDFADHGNHLLFDELILKTVQYLAVKEDKSLFKVISKNNYYENESISFDAELYNESYELINDPEVSLVISDEKDKKYSFVFTKTNNSYHLDAGVFPVGNYKYEAKTKVGANLFSSKGEFSVAELQMEITNTVADHQLLYSLSKKNGGDMYYPVQLDKLAEVLLSSEDIKPISHSEKKLSDLINLKWIFFLLLILISLEWFIRKINGAY